MSANYRNFSHVRIHVRPDGERFPTVFEEYGVPAHYPTCLMLNMRARNAASSTMETTARDILHLDQILTYEGLNDLERRLEAGSYLSPEEIDRIVEGCGIKSKRLRSLNDPKVTTSRRIQTFTKNDSVTTGVKNRRIAAVAQYVDLVARFGEANTCTAGDRKRLSGKRKAMLENIRARQSLMRSSRIRGRISATDLSEVVKFVIYGDPSEIWSGEASRLRNWAIVTVLVLCGLRQGELRQLKASDVDTSLGILDLMRRPDDPEDPRPREPNAKTADRRIPMIDLVSDRIDEYSFNVGDEVASQTGSPFLFLTVGGRSLGEPISRQVVAGVVAQLGQHLKLKRLHPHALRSAWIQHLVDWAIETGVEMGELDRFANYLGGWSYLSQMASHYRGDHLTQKAIEAGLKVEERR